MPHKPSRGATPRLRFPEFQDAGAWEEQSLDSIAFFSKGKGISKADIDVNGETPCIRYGELYTIYDEVINRVVSKTNLPRPELFLSQKNDVLIPSSGETKIDIAKASCVMLNGVALGSDLNVLRTSENGVFLSYLLNGPYKREIAKKAQGDTVVHLYANQLKLLQIVIPSPPEQQRIAECLTALDDLIAAQAQQLDALKAYKTGLMQQLFPAEGESVPRLRFPEFEGKGEWEEKLLGDLLLSRPDYGINAPAVPYSEDLPAYLRITDISEEGVYLSGKKVSVDIDVRDENYLEEGDITLARTGASVGKSYKYKIEDGALVFAGYLIRIKPDANKIVSAFLFNFLFTKQYWKWVGATSMRSGQPGINGNEYANLSVPVPPINEEGELLEQRRIADCLTALDDLIAAQRQKLDALKAHKTGLMQQLFPVVEQ